MVKDFEIVAGVFVAIFILGIGVGVIAVIAMSVLTRHRDYRQRGDRQFVPRSRDEQPPSWEVPPTGAIPAEVPAAGDDPWPPRW